MRAFCSKYRIESGYIDFQMEVWYGFIAKSGKICDFLQINKFEKQYYKVLIWRKKT